MIQRNSDFQCFLCFLVTPTIFVNDIGLQLNIFLHAMHASYTCHACQLYIFVHVLDVPIEK
jgi:hypothetical protein